jgi:hypothetical protein
VKEMGRAAVGRVKEMGTVTREVKEMAMATWVKAMATVAPRSLVAR